MGKTKSSTGLDKNDTPMRLMDCWAVDYDPEMCIPENVAEFNSHSAFDTGCSRMWSIAALLSQSMHACNFKVRVKKNWCEPVSLSDVESLSLWLQTVAYIVTAAPSGRGKSPVCSKHIDANLAVERHLELAYITQVTSLFCCLETVLGFYG